MTIRRLRDRFAAAIVALAITGCATDKGLLTDVLDESSGASHVQPHSPLRLARVRPGLAAIGGDFVFVAPLLVNRRGSSRHFFWLAPASTVDRQLAGLAPEAISRVILLLDGEPMSLELTPWAEVSPISPFDVGMFKLGEFAARATPSQIARVATATHVDILLLDSAGRSHRFDGTDADRRAWLALGSEATGTSQRIARSDQG